MEGKGGLAPSKARPSSALVQLCREGTTGLPFKGENRSDGML